MDMDMDLDMDVDMDMDVDVDMDMDVGLQPLECVGATHVPRATLKRPTARSIPPPSTCAFSCTSKARKPVAK